MKIGFALGGGGAKGFAHIGILKALRDAGINCEIVTGTSVGALVGSAYAAGKLAELEHDAAGIGLTDLPQLLSPAWSVQGFFSGKNALDLLFELVDVENIEDLPLRFAAVSSDLKTAEPVTLTRGNLRRAVRASISIPGIFTPVQHEGYLLVDGGVLEPVPIQAARELGADFIIAVDLFGHSGAPVFDSVPVQIEEQQLESLGENAEMTTPESGTILQSALTYLRSLTAKLPAPGLAISDVKRKLQPHLIDILIQTLVLSQRRLTTLQMKEFPANVHICPNVSDVGILDFHRGSPIIERGRIAAEEAMPEILEKIRNFERPL